MKPPRIRQVGLDLERLRGGCAQCRTVEVSRAMLFKCPAPYTVLRVLAAAGGRMERLSDTVLVLANSRDLTDPDREKTEVGRHHPGLNAGKDRRSTYGVKSA